MRENLDVAVFPAKTHLSAVLITFGLVAGLLVYGTLQGLSPDPHRRLVGLGECGLSVFIVLVSWPLRYEVGDGKLKIRSGVLTYQTLKLSDIKRVYPSRGWPPSYTSSPLAGLRILLEKRTVFTIPDDEEAFLAAIAEQAPQLRRYGGELRA